MKNQTIIDQMTLEEKASLLSGENFWNTKSVERLGIPSIMMTDGPHGLRKQGGKDDNLGLNKSIPATCFPTAATLANSWDVGMLEEVGRSLGRESRHEQVSIILGPGLNIKRNPLCGRNFEYFSEDPHLSGKLAAAMIRGIEEMETSACPKHFAVNSQEHMRMSINEIVDPRAFRELYLEGFRIAVMEGKPGTIMSSYNQVNGEFANENQQLLKEILGAPTTDSLLLDARATLANLKTLSEDLGEATVGAQGMITRVDSTFARLDRMTAQVEAGEGTLGLLMQDSTLVFQAQDVLGALTALLEDLRENPQRYVRLSIF